MNLPFLASFIIFILILSRIIARQNRRKKSLEQSFWEREQQANSVRRKSLDNLDYVKIPFDSLPSDILKEDSTVAECLELLNTLASQPIVNLTGYSNTDLKLEYGTANITALSAYDQNYTLLVRTLQKWADILWDSGYQAEAVTIMEFAVTTHTDISRTYYKLAEYYASRNENEKIQALLETAKNLHSASQRVIVRTLQESYL